MTETAAHEWLRSKVADAARRAGSMNALAADWGVSVMYISDILRGHRNSGPKIISALGLEIDVKFRKAGQR